MNKVYRLIKNRTSGIVQVAPETARTNGKSNNLVITSVLAALLSCTTSATWAADIYWNVPTGDWFIAGNWNPSAVPVYGDDAYIDNGGTAQVQAPGADVGSLVVGSGNSGTLNITGGGTVSNTDGYIGYGSGGTGTVTVDGIGSTWTNSRDLYVGHSGTGTLNISNGGTVSDAWGYIGYSSGSIGTVTVDGIGSTWTNSDNLHVGNGGMLNIKGGGTVSNTEGYIGGDGTVTVDGAGSTWTNSSFLFVGYIGHDTGTLNITNGGTVSSSLGDIGMGGIGTVTVDGAGSTWTNSFYLFVGDHGIGTLNITGGGTVSNTLGSYIGNSRSSGTVTVDGAGSTWTNSGFLDVGRRGIGTLNITGGGTVSDTDGFIGTYSGSTGTVTVDGAGSTWTNSGDLYVGLNGTGTLSITNGGLVKNFGNDGYIGYEGGSTGTVTVDGVGSTWNSYSLSVGHSGSGTLAITNGGAVNVSSIFGGTVLGTYGTGTGTVIVDGAGSTLDTNGFLGLIVGGFGTGELTLINGGVTTVNSGSGTVTLGNNGTGAGTLNIGNGSGAGILDAAEVTSGAGTAILNFNHNESDYYFTNDGTSSGTPVIISGSTSVNQVGSGTTYLTGTNTYTGTTTIDAGTLAVTGSIAGDVTVAGGKLLIGNSSAIGGTITTTGSIIAYADGVNSAAPIILNSNTTQLEVVGTDAATQSGVISETGGSRPMEKIGSGTLTLSATNTYTGTTTVSAGTLSLAGGSAIADSGAVSVSSGATLNLANSETIGSLAGAGSVTLNANTLTTGGNNGSTTYSGVMSGTGGLTKTGTGTLTLSGSNTYTGDTNVNAGTLLINGSIVGDTFVNSGGTLGGSGSLGSVTVNSGGTLSPGNSPGIISLASLTLNAGSTTVMEIDGPTPGTGHDQINVSGTASLDGTLDLQFGYVPTAGATYNLINAGDIVLAGDPTNGFNPITNNLGSNLGAALKVTPVITATEYDILIEQLSFLAAAGGNLTHNQRNVAANLDSFSTSGQAAGLFNALNMLSAGELPGAFDSLSGVQHTHTMPQVAGTTRHFMHILGDRLSWEMPGTNTAATRLGNVQLAYNGENLASLFGAPVKTKPDSNVWLRAMGGFGDIDSDGNASGADYHSGGAAIGFDREVRDGLLAGVAFGFTRSNADMSAGGTDIDSYQLATYGRKQWGNDYIDATIGIGRHRADSRRHVQFDGFSGVAQADYNTDGVGLSLEAGRHYALSATSRVTPFAGLEYGHYRQEGFTETGAGDANLAYGDERMNSLRSVLGARLNNVLSTSGGTQLDTTLGLSWSHEFLDREATLNPAFSVNSNVPFSIKGPVIDRDHVLATLGASARLSKTAQLDLDYSGEFAGSDNHHAISATFRMQW